MKLLTILVQNGLIHNEFIKRYLHGIVQKDSPQLCEIMIKRYTPFGQITWRKMLYMMGNALILAYRLISKDIWIMITSGI